MTAFIKVLTESFALRWKGRGGNGKKEKYVAPGARCWFEESKEGIIAFDVKE